MKDSKNRGLTKAGIVDVVHRRHGGLTKHEAAEVVDAVLKTVKTSLLDGRPVKIANFGVFEVIDRPERTGVSPADGQKISIPPHRGLNFRPAHRLKEVVDDAEPVRTGADD